MTNTSNLPVEALESEYPLTLLRYELVDGSGGAGRQRGGMGLRRVYRAEAPTAGCGWTARALLSRALGPGRRACRAARARSATVRAWRRSSTAPAMLQAGQIVEIVTPGAGGYGPPAARAPDAVRRDVAERRIGPDAARATYPQLTREDAAP